MVKNLKNAYFAKISKESEFFEHKTNLRMSPKVPWLLLILPKEFNWIACIDKHKMLYLKYVDRLPWALKCQEMLSLLWVALWGDYNSVPYALGICGILNWQYIYTLKSCSKWYCIERLLSWCDNVLFTLQCVNLTYVIYVKSFDKLTVRCLWILLKKFPILIENMQF